MRRGKSTAVTICECYVQPAKWLSVISIGCNLSLIEECRVGCMYDMHEYTLACVERIRSYATATFFHVVSEKRAQTCSLRLDSLRTPSSAI